MIDNNLTQKFNETILKGMEEFDSGISFNLLVCKGDGQVAWTATPLCIDDLYIDKLSGRPLSEKADHRICL
jgi:hypothetical protein